MKIRFFPLVLLLIGCASSPSNIEVDNQQTKSKQVVREKNLDVTFAGDIMAHSVNFRMSDYSLIYKDIEDILLTDDISFANFETPVNDTLPYETYPTFNVQSPYAIAAIEGGFDAFSLSNNHTNDQGLEGIKSSLAFFNAMRDRGVYNAGIKDGENLSYDIIEINGWTILFAAITEIVNSYDYVDYFDVYSYTEKRRTDLKEDIIVLQEEHKHDIFVLSVHVAEPEYDTRITDKRREWFHELLDAGVDIVWGNHPHVTMEWELIKSRSKKENDKLIMYSIGNTISGQTYTRNYEDPLHPREDTGTSLLMHVTINAKSKRRSEVGQAVIEIDAKSTIIATHREENNDVVIKLLTQDFIDSQNKKNADYYTVRLEDMRKITGSTIWK